MEEIKKTELNLLLVLHKFMDFTLKWLFPLEFEIFPEPSHTKYVGELVHEPMGPLHRKQREFLAF